MVSQIQRKGGGARVSEFGTLTHRGGRKGGGEEGWEGKGGREWGGGGGGEGGGEGEREGGRGGWEKEIIESLRNHTCTAEFTRNWSRDSFPR